MGSPAAPVTIIEFSDYQCPYCRRYVVETMPRIKENYVDTGKVRYVFKDLPLSFHQHAQQAAESARCAGVQGAYWEMHDRLFASQGEWSQGNEETVLGEFIGYADDLGLDVSAFEACLDSGQFADLIAQDMEEAQRAGVRGTPSFLINGQLVVGAYPFEQFQQIIDAALAQQQ